MLIRDIPEDFVLVTNSQDVIQLIGLELFQCFQGLFVKDDIIYGFAGSVPYLDKTVQRIH